jgi:hypothetical protein
MEQFFDFWAGHETFFLFIVSFATFPFLFGIMALRGKILLFEGGLFSLYAALLGATFCIAVYDAALVPTSVFLEKLGAMRVLPPSVFFWELLAVLVILTGVMGFFMIIGHGLKWGKEPAL